MGQIQNFPPFTPFFSRGGKKPRQGLRAYPTFFLPKREFTWNKKIIIFVQGKKIKIFPTFYKKNLEHRK